MVGNYCEGLGNTPTASWWLKGGSISALKQPDNEQMGVRVLAHEEEGGQLRLFNIQQLRAGTVRDGCNNPFRLIIYIGQLESLREQIATRSCSLVDPSYCSSFGIKNKAHVLLHLLALLTVVLPNDQLEENDAAAAICF